MRLLLIFFLSFIYFSSYSQCGDKPTPPPSYNNPQYKSTKEYKKYKKELNAWDECMNSSPKNYNDSDNFSEGEDGFLDETNPAEIKYGVRFSNEATIRKYFENNGADLIEGVWESVSGYKLAFFKDDFKYVGYILENNGNWKVGDIKCSVETAASEEILTIRWNMRDKKSTRKVIGTVENNALIKFNLNNTETILYRVFPKLKNSTKNFKDKGNIKDSKEWSSNGSGVIVSRKGHIITNYHVLAEAEYIEVEFLLGDEIKSFQAEVVKLDKINDLALLKINDKRFNGVQDVPFSMNSRSSDIGTKVYAYGYPYVSIMGKEIKITDGMISSKTGYDGDITKYQITAPIQGGNSGGPLFDEHGNLLGINTSKIVADKIENVAYTIKSSYVLNLLDVLPGNISFPSTSILEGKSLINQIKIITPFVVLVKVKD